ncbi:hypothetical protein ACOMHN_003946 [Nucella lapillus]
MEYLRIGRRSVTRNVPDVVKIRSVRVTPRVKVVYIPPTSRGLILLLRRRPRCENSNPWGVPSHEPRMCPGSGPPPYHWCNQHLLAPHRLAPHRLAPHRLAPHRLAPHRAEMDC